MKTYTKDQLFGEIYLNENTKFTSTQWEEDKFITQENGQIIDQEGNPFNLMTAKDTEWSVWVEPKPTQNTPTITKEEAVKALYNGKRVKALSWDNKALELKQGQILLNDKTPFNIMTAKDAEWVIIEECKEPQSESQQIAELKAMLEEVLLAQSSDHALQDASPSKNTDGRSTQAQSNTIEKLKDVYGVTTPIELQAQFKKKLETAHGIMDIQKTVSEYIPYCWIGDRTLGTTSVYYSNMRNVIKELKNEEHRDAGLFLFVAPQSVYEVVQEKITENKKEEIRNKNTFDLQAVKDVMTKIKHKIIADTFETDKDIERQKAYLAYSYLAIVTGRRQTEILKTLEIKKEKGIWQYCGITKDRKDGKCVEAFSLDSDFEFLSDLLDYVQGFTQNEIKETIDNKLRKIVDSKERATAKKELEEFYSQKKSINSKFNSTFNPAITRVTNMPYTPKMWRGIYAEMLWIKENKKEDNKEGSHIDKRDFKAKVLGHKYDGKLSATEHYDSSWEAV